MRAMGFHTLLADRWLSPIIVTFHAPGHPRFDFRPFYQILIKRRGFIIYPGKLTQVDSFRIGCIGQLFEEQMRGVLTAIRAALDEMDIPDGSPRPEDSYKPDFLKPPAENFSMYFHYQRSSYRGPVQAVILDWAGTTVDFGSLAPAMAFVQLFAEQGVAISVAEVRGPMGTGKARTHPPALSVTPAIAARWRDATASEPGEADVDRLYELSCRCKSPRSATRATDSRLPGDPRDPARAASASARIPATAAMMPSRCCAPPPSRAMSPDSAVCATEVPRGRPYPYMSLKNDGSGNRNRAACVKVDDTVPGIEEGLNAGMWTVGVAISGNEIGLPLAGWEALPFAEQQQRRERAYQPAPGQRGALCD
jgi:phosphonoacetaldehyde hydrolase